VKYVLAISGGVDSVVLLDMAATGKLFQSIERSDLSVAHFDHGIRSHSARDAEFVRRLAVKYGLKFYQEKAQLGPDASEELARKKRYEFLRQVKKTAGADKIVTAHHEDDLLETIAMNLIRGSGWRGLAPFWSDDIWRPLLDMAKVEIVQYAIENGLDWVEDETNFSAKYFRNRVRNFAARMSPAQRKSWLTLNQRQVKLRSEIEKILSNQLPRGRTNFDRQEIIAWPENVAMEILRAVAHAKLTKPQTKRLLKFIKIARSGDICQPGGGLQIGVYRDQITVTNINRYCKNPN
jgi:tRNA(Ile)-lysidine synthase